MGIFVRKSIMSPVACKLLTRHAVDSMQLIWSTPVLQEHLQASRCRPCTPWRTATIWRQPASRSSCSPYLITPH